MALRRFTPDRTFEVEILSSTGLGELLQPLTAQVADRARSIFSSRSVKAGIGVSVGLGPGGMRGRVVGEDFKTGWFEFGTSRIPAERGLGRALEEIIGPVQSSSS